MPSPADLDALKRIIVEKSYTYGIERTLASGRKSLLYFNLKPTMLDPEGASVLGRAMLDLIGPDEAGFVGGPEMGGVPLATLVAAESFRQARPLRAFFVRKKPKEHGTQSLIEGLMEGETLSGAKTVIVEDTTTTGGSALKAVNAVREAGARVAAVVAIVDREEGAAEAFAEAKVDFRALLKASDFPRG